MFFILYFFKIGIFLRSHPRFFFEHSSEIRPACESTFFAYPRNIEPAFLEKLFRHADAAHQAVNDLAEAISCKVTRGEAKDVSFIRRFRMKDGGARTNPGWQNPDIVHPMQSAFDEKGYEASTSRYVAGTAEKLIETSNEIIKALKKL